MIGENRGRAPSPHQLSPERHLATDSSVRGRVATDSLVVCCAAGERVARGDEQRATINEQFMSCGRVASQSLSHQIAAWG